MPIWRRWATIAWCASPGWSPVGSAPGTASGVLFLTLEDETGNSNIVVWESTQKRFRKELMSAQLLLVKGTLETKDNVIHIIAGALIDYTSELQTLPVQSRDFH